MLEVTVKVWGIRFVGKSVIMWTFSKLNVHRPKKRMPKQWQAYKGQKSVFIRVRFEPERTKTPFMFFFYHRNAVPVLFGI